MGFNEALAVLFVLLGGFGVPVGVPPAPEDPMMARVISDDAMAVASWAGIAEVDPDADPTQAWLAQPEIRTFSKKLVDAWRVYLGDESPQVPEIKNLLANVSESAASNGATICVRHFDFEGRPEKFLGSAFVPLGDFKQPVVELLEEFSDPDNEYRSDFFSWEEKNGVKRFRYTDPRNEQVSEIAIWKDYFIVGIGEGELDRVVANTQTEPPAWYAERRQQLPVKKFCSMSYVSKNLVGSIPDDTWQVFGWRPLDSFQGMFVVSGVDEKGMLMRGAVDLIDGKDGIEDLIETEPLDKKFFERLPERPTLGGMVRVSLDEVIKQLADAGKKIGEDPIEEADQRLQEELGVGLRDELLNVLDGFVGLHYTLDAARPFEQLVVTFGISDELSFPTLHDTVLDSIRKWEGRDDQKLQEHKHGLFEIYSFPIRANLFGKRMLAWSNVREELVLATDVESIKRHIDNTQEDRTFATTDACKDLLEFGEQNQLGNPIAVGTIDVATLARELMNIFGGFTRDDSEIFGNLKFGDIPDIKVLTNGVEPNVFAVYRAKNGFQLYGRQTLPNSSPVVSVLAGAALSGVANLDRLIVDEMTHSQNNLRQLAISCLNFESASRRLPAAGTMSADGKPLLSWRVHILPYLGQLKLYKQFHLDEPWDSPHNKSLIAQMPADYKRLGIKLEEGKTVYLGVAGRNGPFGMLNKNREGAGIGRITDGTSNSVLVVECGKAAAEVWTKPADLSTNGEQAVVATRDAVKGITNVVMCDGSVHQLKKVSADVWSRLLNMRDGKVENVEDHAPAIASP